MLFPQSLKESRGTVQLDPKYSKYGSRVPVCYSFNIDMYWTESQRESRPNLISEKQLQWVKLQTKQDILNDQLMHNERSVPINNDISDFSLEGDNDIEEKDLRLKTVTDFKSTDIKRNCSRCGKAIIISRSFYEYNEASTALPEYCSAYCISETNLLDERLYLLQRGRMDMKNNEVAMRENHQLVMQQLLYAPRIKRNNNENTSPGLRRTRSAISWKNNHHQHQTQSESSSKITKISSLDEYNLSIASYY